MAVTNNRGYVKRIMVALSRLVIARKASHLLKANSCLLNQFIASVLAAALCVSSVQTFAAVSLTQWGATARTDSADCTGSLFGGCNIFDLTLEEGNAVGGSQTSSATIGSASAGSTTGLQGRGSAGASVQIPASGLGVPVLRTRAESTMDDFFVSGAALGIQAYQFTGADGTAVSLDASLDGLVTKSSTSSDLTGLEVNVWIMSASTPFTFPADPVPVSELVAQIIVDATLAGVDPFIDSMAWDAVSTGTGAINRSTTSTDLDDRLTFSLNNGDEFYLMAALSAGADGVGASALSWSTLTMEFNTTDLQAASVVPLPAALWLFGSGLVGLISIASRKRWYISANFSGKHYKDDLHRLLGFSYRRPLC
jgi:hypothetical protein